MSHELRTPLNAVLGFAQLLGRSAQNPLDARQREMVAHVTRGGEHLLRLDRGHPRSRAHRGRQLAIQVEPVDVGRVSPRW